MPLSRRRRSRPTRAAAAAGAALVLCAALAPAARAGEPADGLFLTVAGAGDTWIRGVRLVCPASRGPHPHATAACDELARAHGDLDALRGDPHLCTREYDPVTVAASGNWRGVPVDWRREYPNTCTMDAATGPVFRF
ncbi:subtilase-type protease inhibitor [Streptomyces sp. RS10V-4]|uniref:SSI family serine proteinase inhibitor n=1 Tax=Streptomyces rhizoryzae TaxID=2932493 RepID=UPI002005B996|nr:SSI family serine proteinase inhibitor [Streptomyces rhizoryzae]MCK7626337.1 subtilase-type protease inhibitor [Streptomyces rhizoryzae]